MQPYNNDKIQDWATDNLADIKAEIDALGIKHVPKSPSPKALKNSITKKIRMRNGAIDKISYGMPRSGVFVHKGVGKGRPITSSKLKAKRWYSNPTNRNYSELQNIVAEEDATFIVNNLSIK